MGCISSRLDSSGKNIAIKDTHYFSSLNNNKSQRGKSKDGQTHSSSINGENVSSSATTVKHKGCFTDEYFTGAQKRQVLATWPLITKDPIKHGTNVFLYIFSSKPETQDLFPFRGLQGEDLAKNPVFRSHAVRFINVVTNVVNNMDALEVVCIPTLLTLGKYHVKTVQFFNNYLHLAVEGLHQVFKDELGPEIWTQEVNEAWLAVFQFIADKMAEGYYGEHQRSACSVNHNTEKTDYNVAQQDTDQTKKTQNVTNSKETNV